jgi:HAMP domain-containing protein
MSQLDILKTVAIALVLLILGVAGFVQLNPLDPMLKFASVVALGVVSLAASLIFFYAALNSDDAV